jgi:hypothetical protein
MTEERTRVEMAEGAWWKMNCDKGRATYGGNVDFDRSEVIYAVRWEVHCTRELTGQ